MMPLWRIAHRKFSGVASPDAEVLGGCHDEAISGGFSPTQDGRVHRIQRGRPVRGTVAEDHRSFQGIPYAAPPVGELRWRSPRPAAGWGGTRDATKPGSSCPQNPGLLGDGGSASEDCLYVNVTTPRRAPARSLPVMQGTTRDEHRTFTAGLELITGQVLEPAEYDTEVAKNFGEKSAAVLAKYPRGDQSASIALSTVATDSSWGWPSGSSRPGPRSRTTEIRVAAFRSRREC